LQSAHLLALEQRLYNALLVRYRSAESAGDLENVQCALLVAYSQQLQHSNKSPVVRQQAWRNAARANKTGSHLKISVAPEFQGGDSLRAHVVL